MTASRQSLPGPAPIRVLIVDDEQSVHRLVADRLAGFELLHAYNGRQAREQVRERRINLVLLDLNLPDTTGLDLLEEGFGRATPAPIVVLFSMESSPSLLNRAQRLGAADYLEKSAENFVSLAVHLERILRRSSEGRSDAR